LEEMFAQAAVSTEIRYTYAVSVLEVYNETVHDLLCRGSGGNDLNIRLRKDEVYVENLTECEVATCDDVEELMQLASSNRSTANNNVNEHSSRSHLVLSVRVTGENIRNGTRVVGKLNLIDLAGSERLKNTNATGDRLKEAQSINKSLSALGDVINALGADQKHVPYRNSKLTFLLQDSLKQSAKCLMFVNINPSPRSAGESVCSLNFAARCRAVQLGKAKKDNISVKG
jgi:kinesin family protein C2/C3